MNGLEEISLANVGMGGAEEKFNEALARVAKDVIARSAIAGSRKVTLTVELAPDVQEEGNFPDVNWKVSWSVPGSKGMATKAYVEGDKLLVNPNTANPRQRTIHDPVDDGNVHDIKKGGKNK